MLSEPTKSIYLTITYNKDIGMEMWLTYC